LSGTGSAKSRGKVENSTARSSQRVRTRKASFIASPSKEKSTGEKEDCKRGRAAAFSD
jgi:hypothetical protein